MDQGESANHRLNRLREYRNPKDRDLTLGFLDKQFQKQVAKPYKQLQGVADVWRELVPAELLDHTRLESLTRGVLRVTVDSSAHHYTLDRMLRSGLQKQLTDACRSATVRRVQLRVGRVDSDPPSRD